MSKAQEYVTNRHRHAYVARFNGEARFYCRTEIGGWNIAIGRTQAEAWENAELALRKLEAEQKAEHKGPPARVLMKPPNSSSGAYW